MDIIKQRWAKNLGPEERLELYEARNERDRDAARKRARRDRVKTAARKYHITEECLQSLIDDANGICCICTGPLGDKLCIDHNHNTGAVRNVLCAKCNNGLGQFNDSVETLERAVEYLKSY